jgi:hypothetical protein
VRASRSNWQNYLVFRIVVGQGAGSRDPVLTGCGSERVNGLKLACSHYSFCWYQFMNYCSHVRPSLGIKNHWYIDKLKCDNALAASAVSLHRSLIWVSPLFRITGLVYKYVTMMKLRGLVYFAGA